MSYWAMPLHFFIMRIIQVKRSQKYQRKEAGKNGHHGSGPGEKEG